MPDVVTITFNPCIDKTLAVHEMLPEKKMHARMPTYEPGGGGINVARGIYRLGGSVSAVYTAGGCHGKLLSDLLHKELIPVNPIPIEKLTRESWVILDQSTGKQYRIVMPGPQLSASEWQQCLDQLDSIEDVKFIVVSGSMPENMPEDIYNNIGIIAARKNAKVVVDSSGESLINALKSSVYLIKPSLSELASVIVALNIDGFSLTDAALELIKRNYCEVVVVSMGAGGAWLISAHKSVEIKAPHVKTMSTVGAGDSMVAGLIFGLVNEKTLEEAVRFGVACGSACTLNPGTALFKISDAEELYSQLKERLLDREGLEQRNGNNAKMAQTTDLNH
ncbi:MAG: phosphofructokinase [Bacteroidetes bacterium]|nr:MAG: phosphofructokinase [Bacteroidota bacterium]